MSFSLKLLGGIALAGERGPLTGPAVQRHRLALLTLLAIARPRAVSREKLMAWLWPERESEPARRLLNQAVHALRQALGAEAIVSAGDDLQLDLGMVHCDVVAFEEALSDGDRERAVGLYTGPFLDGFFLDEAPEFERWVDRERDRLSAGYAKALEGLAEAAEGLKDSSMAVERWKARAAHDPYDSRVALRLMQALEQAGNRAGALQHAITHQQLLRQELEIEPVPGVQALVERLRQEPAHALVPPKERAQRQPTESPIRLDRAAVPGPPDPLVLEASPRRRRTIWYGVAVVLAAAAGGAIRLATGGGANEGRAVVAPMAMDEIAKAVASELDRRQRGDTAVRLPRHRTRSIPAYELYLRGDDPALLRSDSAARKGLEYFQRAVALDPSYGAAWAGVARMTIRSAREGHAARLEARRQAEIAIRKALALDDSLAEAHASFGLLRGMQADFAAAEQHIRRAIALDPSRSRLREWFVHLLLMTGRPAEALTEAERALVLDPLSPSVNAELARALAANNRCGEALARLENIRALDPPLLRVASIAARCYTRQGRYAEAITMLRPQAQRDSGLTLALLGHVSGRAGQRAEARAIQARLLDRWRRDKSGAIYLAYVPAALGNLQEAFTWMDRGLDDGSFRFEPGTLVDLSDLPFDVLEHDPRMNHVRERLGLQKR